MNRWFELNFKKLFEMLEFIQPSRISTEPWFHQNIRCSFWYPGKYRNTVAVPLRDYNGHSPSANGVFFLR
jgi:hypothetical protein